MFTKQNITRSLIASCICLLTACSGHQDSLLGDESGEKQSRPIKFNFFLQDGDRSVALSTLTRANNTLDDGFSLYGFTTSQDVPTELNTAANTSPEDASKRFFDGEAVTKLGDYGTALRYWVTDATTRHSFFAYSGVAYDGNNGYGVKGVKGLTTTDFFPRLEYVQASDPAQQQDYLVAYGPTNLVVHQATPEVNMHFRHACAKVIFKIMVSGGVNFYNTKVEMTYGVDRVSNTGEVYFTPQTATTTATEYSTGTFTLGGDLMIPISANTEGKAVTAGELLLLPQEFTTSGWMELAVSYSLSQNTDAGEQSKSKVPGVKIEPGKQYVFYFTLAENTPYLSITNLVIEPWEIETPIVDLLD